MMAMVANTPWRDEGVLRRLYHGEELTIQEVADELDCDYSTVIRWMDRLEIERRERGTSPCDERYRNEEWLRQKYIDEKLSMNQISDICDCSISTIKLWIDKHGIEPRSRGIGRSIRAGPLTVRTQDTGHEVTTAWYNYVPSVGSIHRLCAVAWFGWDAVAGNVVHHDNGIPWDNREENLVCMSDKEHRRLHVERGDNLNRDNHD